MVDHDKVKVFPFLLAALHGGAGYQGEGVPHPGGEGAGRHRGGVPGHPQPLMQQKDNAFPILIKIIIFLMEQVFLLKILASMVFQA